MTSLIKMSFKLFSKNKKATRSNGGPRAQKSSGASKPDSPAEEVSVRHETGAISATGTEGFSLGVGRSVLKNFYVSEKASGAGALNQYVFKVFSYANKPSVKKQVARSYGVKVKRVKILNMPGKAKKWGQTKGRKPGFKKAVVVLEKGYAIEQAKP